MPHPTRAHPPLPVRSPKTKPPTRSAIQPPPPPPLSPPIPPHSTPSSHAHPPPGRSHHRHRSSISHAPHSPLLPTQSPLQSLLPTHHTDRNIQSVVLGDAKFDTWFHSLYPEELVPGKGEVDGLGINGSGHFEERRGVSIGRGRGGRKDERILYVCQWCFRYCGSWEGEGPSGEGGMGAHAKTCELKSNPPGTKIYDHNYYEIWEVDGLEHKLFCQNLSLFAKLFLDHKSVFFDVSSFLYYLLVYRSPRDPTTSPVKVNGFKSGERAGANGEEEEEDGEHHILGFFSKELPSWDLNNLACILIFPPYQHRSLGKLLMGISYSLQLPGVIGGPEKPLSELGRRGYMRFWMERVARWVVGYPDVESGGGESVAERQGLRAKGKGKGRGRGKGRKRSREDVISVRDVSKGTGMLVEDVTTALTGMGVVEDEPTSPRKKVKKLKDEVNGAPADGEVKTDGEAEKEKEESEEEKVVVRKSKVMEWVERNRVDLTDPVDEECFLGEYKWVEISDSEVDE